MQKALPPSNDDNTIVIIPRKNSEKKLFMIGIFLCLILGMGIYMLSLETLSIEARLEREREAIFSPVGGKVYEILVKDGDDVRQGAAMLRFDPTYIRQQVAFTAEYLDFFRQNRHNSGTLRQKFRPIFGDMFDELSGESNILRKQEQLLLEKIEKLSDTEAAILVAKRDIKNEGSDGLPKKEFVKQAKDIAAEITNVQKEWEQISLQRAGVDKQMREITNNLGEPHGILYRYLEERNQAVQDIVRHENVYAPYDLRVGRAHVEKGEDVATDDLLFEVYPTSGKNWLVEAVFDWESGKDIQVRDKCTLILENEDELRAKVLSKREVDGEILLTLVVLAPPLWLEPSDHVTVRL